MATTGKIRTKFSIVVARDLKNGIGYEGNLPWPRLKSDLKFLREKTSTTQNKETQNAVIMGRKTWEFLPRTIRPLSNRYNIVLSSKKREDIPDAHMVCPSMGAAFEALQTEPLCNKIESIFVLGGSAIFEEAMASEMCDKLYITEVDGVFPADTYFPPLDTSVYKLLKEDDPLAPKGVVEENGVKFKFTVYQRQT